jgi:hypothetical protein
MTTATEKPKLTRRTRIALIAAAVLALAGVCIVLANVTSSPPPKQYKVTATGNVRATWYSDSTMGNLDLDSGYDIQTVTANSLSVSVDSTLPRGASCRIEGPNGETYVNHARANGDTIVTATCATK